MKCESQVQLFFHKPGARAFVLVLLFATAFCIRLYHINTPLLDFSQVRQYQQAHIARGYYFENMESVPEWKKEVARLNMQRMGFLLEPRIIEYAAVLGYRITGGEDLWIPRVLSSIFWLIGGVFLYFIAKKIVSIEAALFSTTFYLFLPYSISSSRSFQPDPMMVMMILISIFYICRYFDQPSKIRLLAAALLSALAILIKPYSLFLIFCTFSALSINKEGIKKTLFSLNSLIFTSVSFLPVTLYYLSRLVADVGYLKEHAQNSFVPNILIHSYFWKDWYTIIGDVIGYVPFLAAIIGVFIAKEGLPRLLLITFWIGYIIFGISATHHIHTHNYYQMQFIPVVALSLGPLVDSIIKHLSGKAYTRLSLTALGVLLLAVLSSVSMSTMRLKSMRSVIGINPEFKQFIMNNFSKEVGTMKEIGEIVDHSTKTVLLTSDYGRSLAYHGELSGFPWPLSDSLLERKERGLWIPSKEELFNPRYLTIRIHDKYIQYSPDYFIIMDFKEYNEQKDLKEFLNANFPVISKSDDYLIFDLRSMNK